MMDVAVLVVGVGAEAFVWWHAWAAGRDLWRLVPPVLAAMGIAAVAVVGVRPLGGDVAAGTAIGVGAGAGVALFIATRVFVSAASRWEPFRRHVSGAYGRARTIPFGAQIVLALVVTVPGEELFWRGLAVAQLERAFSAGPAAAAAWVVYVVVNAASRSLPITAAAIVGGGVWAILAWWSGGVIAGLASHILWTGLMLAFPPGAGQKERV
jgi:membrane protease YdiL (CAAX protease family)